MSHDSPSQALPMSAQSTPQISMPICLSYAHMPPIYSLPPELLTRIFQLGVDSDPLPDDRDPTQLTFEVTVSHVCSHWRHLALHTPHLWTTVHFRTISHMERGAIYLSRNPRLPIDIYVDTCSEDTHSSRKDLLFRDQFLPVFNILLPEIHRWRELHLKVADLQCKGHARKVLGSCGPAPALRTLQLWHVQNWMTPERLFGAIGPPPVVVFAGSLPSLQHIILQGVNLPWANSPFLSNLTSIEYALHSDDVRMPWQKWRDMLDSSPNLKKLSLHYSGPRARSSGTFPPDGIDWWGAPPDVDLPPGAGHPPAADPVYLPRLQEVELHDLDADYLVALFRTIDAPALRSLHLELNTEDQDFTPFVEYLAAPPPTRHTHAHSPTPDSPEETGARPVSKFPVLETLCVAALQCSVESWRALLESAARLTRLEVDFMYVPEGAWDVLLESVRAEPSGGEKSAHGEDGGEHAQGKEEREREEVPILPALRAVRFAGVSGKQVAVLARHRRVRGRPIARWEVEEGARDVEGEALEREMEEASARWRAEQEARRESGTGDGWEPWRLDEPVEKLVWYREEVAEYDEEEDEEDEEGDDGDGAVEDEGEEE